MLFHAYRGESQVEMAFRCLKGPVWVSPVFLKSNLRIAAFGHIALMAYLVYTLIQRAIRMALSECGTLEIEGRKTERPNAPPNKLAKPPSSRREPETAGEPPPRTGRGARHG